MRADPRLNLTAVATVSGAGGAGGLPWDAVARPFLPVPAQDGGPPVVCLTWGEPRDVVGIRVGAPAAETVDWANDVRVEYWRDAWPPTDPGRLRGGRVGWTPQDDPFHGQWVRAVGGWVRGGAGAQFQFDPLDVVEIDDADLLERAADYRPRFRRTLKVRLVFRQAALGPAPLSDIDVLSRYALIDGECVVEGVDPATAHVTVWNGQLADRGGDDSAEAGPPALRLRYQYVGQCPNVGDRTVITVRAPHGTFSFNPEDLREGPLDMPEIGVRVRGGTDQAPQAFPPRPGDSAARDLYTRVGRVPEQTFQRAVAEIPRLDPTLQNRYCVLSWDGTKQRFALRYDGDVFLDRSGLRLRGRDAAALHWPGQRLHYRFGTGDPCAFHDGRADTVQAARDGWLPIYSTGWDDRLCQWRSTAFAALSGSPRAFGDLRGDEETICCLRFRVRNARATAARATLWMTLSTSEELEADGGAIWAVGRWVPEVHGAVGWRLQRYEAPALRAVWRAVGGGTLTVCRTPRPEGPETARGAVRWESDLGPDGADAVDLVIPFVSAAPDADTLHRIDVDAKEAEVEGYWRAMVGDGGGAVRVPNADVTDLVRAVPWHVAMTAVRDPGTGTDVLPPASYHYNACGNEAALQILLLDRLGHHARAERYLETFLATQGTVLPDGDFGSAEGALQAIERFADGDIWPRRFNYCLDHGFLLHWLAEHYLLTRDRPWLRRAAPHLLAACDFVVRERRRTMRCENGERVPEYGLLPAGKLEDNREWRYCGVSHKALPGRGIWRRGRRRARLAAEGRDVRDLTG